MTLERKITCSKSEEVLSFWLNNTSMLHAISSVLLRGYMFKKSEHLVYG